MGSILVLGDERFQSGDWIEQLESEHLIVTRASDLSQTQGDSFDIIFTDLTLPTHPSASLSELSKRNSVLVVLDKHLPALELVKGGAHYVLSGTIAPQDAKWVIDSALRIKTKKSFSEPRALRSKFHFFARDMKTGPYHLALLDSLEGINLVSRDEKMRLLLAYQEVITNAIEHGCLELDSRLKEFTNGEGIDAFSAEKKRRLADPFYGDRRVFVEASFEDNKFTLIVEDEGRGFLSDFFLKLEPDRLYGRGLELLKCIMDLVVYQNHGKRVELKKCYGSKV